MPLAWISVPAVTVPAAPIAPSDGATTGAAAIGRAPSTSGRAKKSPKLAKLGSGAPTSSSRAPTAAANARYSGARSGRGIVRRAVAPMTLEYADFGAQRREPTVTRSRSSVRVTRRPSRGLTAGHTPGTAPSSRKPWNYRPRGPAGTSAWGICGIPAPSLRPPRKCGGNNRALAWGHEEGRGH